VCVDVIEAAIENIDLKFKTSPSVFSPRILDRGTLAMLSAVEFAPDDFVLDLGCGYGVVGILAAKMIGPEKVVMTDIDEQAVRLSKENAALNGVAGIKIVRSDGFRDVSDTGFSLILSNPPYHADFSTPKHFIHKGFNRLKIGGRLYMVVKREKWYRNKLIRIFGGTDVRSINGYGVFMSVKNRATYASV